MKVPDAHPPPAGSTAHPGRPHEGCLWEAILQLHKAAAQPPAVGVILPSQRGGPPCWQPAVRPAPWLWVGMVVGLCLLPALGRSWDAAARGSVLQLALSHPAAQPGPLPSNGFAFLECSAAEEAPAILSMPCLKWGDTSGDLRATPSYAPRK